MAKSLLATRYLIFVRSQELRDYNKQARKYGIGSALGYPGTRDSLPSRKQALKQYLPVFAGRENSLIIDHSQILHSYDVRGNAVTGFNSWSFLIQILFCCIPCQQINSKERYIFSCIRYSKRNKIYNLLEREAHAPRVTPTRITSLKRVRLFAVNLLSLVGVRFDVIALLFSREPLVSSRFGHISVWLDFLKASFRSR